MMGLREDYETLAAEMRECTKCGLCAVRHKVVVDRGDPTAKLMFIGEAPGANEDAAGQAFVGRAGAELDRLLEEAGVEKFIIINVLKCFPGDTVVSANGVERGFKRYYAGPLVTAVAGKHKISGTPNHPVLTRRGWVALDQLVAGDDLVCGTLDKRVGLGDPDVDHGPSKIREVVDALSDSGISERVVGSDVDFHGDGVNSYVDVVSRHRLLGLTRQTTSLQHLDHRVLERAYEGLSLSEPPGATPRALLKRGQAALLSSHRCIRCLGQLSPLDRTGLRHASQHRVRSPSDFNSTLGEESFETSLPDPDALGDWLDAFPGQVSFDKVVDVNRSSFSGHVYNLQTEDGWYIADGVVAANCRPPNNKFPGDYEAYHPADVVDKCIPWLDAQLELIQPRVIILVGGKAAAHTIYRGRKMPAVRDIVGKRFLSVDYPGIDIFGMYHTSFMLRLRNSDQSEYERVREQTLDTLRIAQRVIDGESSGMAPTRVSRLPDDGEQLNFF